jgi:hypothetical protein
MCDYGTINFNTYISYMYEHVLALTYIGYANIQFCCEKAHFEIFSQGKQKTIVHLKSLLPFLACFTQNVPICFDIRCQICPLHVGKIQTRTLESVSLWHSLKMCPKQTCFYFYAEHNLNQLGTYLKLPFAEVKGGRG